MKLELISVTNWLEVSGQKEGFAGLLTHIEPSGMCAKGHIFMRGLPRSGRYNQALPFTIGPLISIRCQNLSKVV
jgi:hypothetical protein